MKRLVIDNFRCYRHFEIEFKPRVNLVVGDNASGKTSLLKACKYALSSFFAGFSDDNTSWSSPARNEFRQITVDGITRPEKSIAISFSMVSGMFPSVEDGKTGECVDPAQAEGLYTIMKRSTKNSRPSVAGLSGFKRYALQLKNALYSDDAGENSKREFALPLFAAFSTEDIHSVRKLQIGKFNDYFPKDSFGYYECLNGAGFLQYWIKRLLVLAETERFQPEAEIVCRAVTDALGPAGCGIIDCVMVRPIRKKVFFRLADGREVDTDQLSDGYRRLVNIVMDIAFRAAILNRGYFGLEAARETRGCVLIDEIDLHLHPSLQGCVLEGLRNAFPNLQIIATTHAPMVMAGVETGIDNGVFRLSYSPQTGYSAVSIDAYGLDVSSVMEQELGLPARDRKVDESLKKLFGLIDEDKIDEAKAMLSGLVGRFGDRLPEVSQAETMISLLSDGYEED